VERDFTARDLAGCCGIYCGLCPKFQSQAKSRCLSCHLGEQHSYCSLYRCCVMKHGLHNCSQCEDFPCPKLLRVLGVEEGLDSFVSHQPALGNLNRIAEIGLDGHLVEQEERRSLVEGLLAEYNEGRSMSFYCLACALMPPDLIRQALGLMKAKINGQEVDASDLKTKAKAMRAVIQEIASAEGIELKLRKKKK